MSMHVYMLLLVVHDFLKNNFCMTSSQLRTARDLKRSELCELEQWVRIEHPFKALVILLSILSPPRIKEEIDDDGYYKEDYKPLKRPREDDEWVAFVV